LSVRFVGSVALLAAVISGCGSSSQPGKVLDDEEMSRPPVEAKLELPALPQEADLVEFYPGASVGGHRYFIDARTLLVGDDRIVRYAMMVRTTGGAVNMTYEGIHCQTREQRLYAIGYRGKGWIEARQSRWEPIRRGRINDHHSMLYSEYFCHEGPIPVAKTAIVQSLRRGLSGASPHRGDR
jgi:hypothetical protein